MIVMPTGYSSTYKVGKYEFFVEIKYRPGFVITKRVKLIVTIDNPRSLRRTWSKSVIIKLDDERRMTEKLIQMCLGDIGYYNQH